MPRWTAAALACAAACTAGCAAAAGIAPPSRTEIGSMTLAGGEQPTHGVRFATGAHLASGQTRRDARFDLGAGYVYERLAAPPPRGLDAIAASRPSRSPDHIEAHGGYVDLATSLDRGRAHRSWIGLRSETLVQRRPLERQLVHALYGRLSWEIYGTGKGFVSESSSKGFGAGFVYGATALGLYLESGVRWGRDQPGAFVATGGLSLRLPWIAGMAFGFR